MNRFWKSVKFELMRRLPMAKATLTMAALRVRVARAAAATGKLRALVAAAAAATVALCRSTANAMAVARKCPFQKRRIRRPWLLLCAIKKIRPKWLRRRGRKLRPPCLRKR